MKYMRGGEDGRRVFWTLEVIRPHLRFHLKC